MLPWTSLDPKARKPGHIQTSTSPSPDRQPRELEDTGSSSKRSSIEGVGDDVEKQYRRPSEVAEISVTNMNDGVKVERSSSRRRAHTNNDDHRTSSRSSVTSIIGRSPPRNHIAITLFTPRSSLEEGRASTVIRPSSLRRSTEMTNSGKSNPSQKLGPRAHNLPSSYRGSPGTIRPAIHRYTLSVDSNRESDKISVPSERLCLACNSINAQPLKALPESGTEPLASSRPSTPIWRERSNTDSSIPLHQRQSILCQGNKDQVIKGLLEIDNSLRPRSSLTSDQGRPNSITSTTMSQLKLSKSLRAAITRPLNSASDSENRTTSFPSTTDSELLLLATDPARLERSKNKHGFNDKL